MTTDDGYILELHRITGPNNNAKADGKEVVFLMHGLLSSSADWVITGPDRALGMRKKYFASDGVTLSKYKRITIIVYFSLSR